MSDREIDLDDFWRGNVHLANVAAQLLTERGGQADSIWAGDPYGSAVVALAESGAADVLIQREIERALAVTEIGGVVEAFDGSVAQVRTLATRLAVSAETVIVPEE